MPGPTSSNIIVASLPLPTGAARDVSVDGVEGKLDTLDGRVDQLEGYVDQVEAKLDTLNSKDFATQVTLAAVLAKMLAAPATEAKQDTGNGSLATIAGKDFATQTTLSSLDSKDALLEWVGSAGAGYAGLTDIDLTPTLAPAVGAVRYVDSIEVSGTDDGGSGAASVIVYLFRDAGATPGTSKLILATSASITIAGGVWADRICPNIRPGFLVPAGQKLYLKVVPNAGTITVSASAWTCAGR